MHIFRPTVLHVWESIGREMSQNLGLRSSPGDYTTFTRVLRGPHLLTAFTHLLHNIDAIPLALSAKPE